MSRRPQHTARPSASATGPVVLLRTFWRFAAYELRNRNATVVGREAAITYVTNERNVG